MKKLTLSLFIIPLLFFASCRDYNELNMQDIVRCAGIDYKDGVVKVSVACDGTDDLQIKTSEGRSFFEAVREMSSRSDKKLYWGQAETLVFGEDAVGGTFSGSVDAILRARDVFLDIIPVVAKDMTAEKALRESGRLFEAFINEGNSRRFEAVPLWKLLRMRELYRVSVIPTVKKEGENFLLAGGAVLSDSGFLGYLSEEEMLLRSLLTDTSEGGYLPVIDVGENASISFEILANDIKISKKESDFIIREEITLSPAEVRGEVDEKEMQSVAEEYLKYAYRDFIESTRARGFGNILNIPGRSENSKISVVPSVKISNVMGVR